MRVSNLKKIAKGGFLALLALFAMSALASSKGPLQLQHPTSVAGKQLATGSYTVEWDGTGDQVSLKIYQGKKEVASTSAQVLKLDQPAYSDQTITSSGTDGASALSEIRFHGKKFSLRLNGESGSGSSGSAQ